MNENEFKSNMRQAETLRRSGEILDGEFWAGYQRGLRKLHHGEAFGTDDEHLAWMAAAEETRDRQRQFRGVGYVAGFDGTTATEAAEMVAEMLLDDTPSRGRPVGSLKPAALTSQISPIRCSDQLHQWLEAGAADEGLTMAAHVRRLLGELMGGS